MTQYGDGRETSRRSEHDDVQGTRTDADVTNRMAGTHRDEGYRDGDTRRDGGMDRDGVPSRGEEHLHRDRDGDGRRDGILDRDGDGRRDGVMDLDRDFDRDRDGHRDAYPVTGARQEVRRDEHVEREDRHDRHDLGRFKTSAAAVFALVFGLAALFCALTAILSPAAVLFGIIGLILGIVGVKMSKRHGVTGKGVAIGGIVTSLLGLLLGGAVLAGLAALVNDERRLDQLQQRIDNLRDDLPTTGEIREELPS